MKTSEPPVTVSQSFTASIDDVWKAISDINEMRQWYFSNIPDFKPEVGFETSFIIENEGRVFPHDWKVTEVKQNKRLVYDWRHTGYAGDAYVVFELNDLDPGTELTVSCHVREDFPEHIPEFKRESCLGGWTYFIKESLKEYFEKKNI